MKAWVLSHGCIHEGGSVDSVYATEAAGLAAAEKYMAEEIARTAEYNTPEDPCRTYFEKKPIKDDSHYWLEHYCCKLGDHMDDFASEYLSLKWYELQ